MIKENVEMKKFVCLITALFLLISVIPGSAAGAEMVNPTVVYTQDFDQAASISELSGFDITNIKNGTAALSNESIYKQDFDSITQPSQAGFSTASDTSTTALKVDNSKLKITKNANGNGTTYTSKFNNVFTNLTEYILSFDIYADTHTSGFMVFNGAGLGFTRTSKSGVYVISYWDTNASNPAWVDSETTVDLSEEKQVVFKVYTVDGQKYADISVDGKTIVTGIKNRVTSTATYSFENYQLQINNSLQGEITIDNVDIYQVSSEGIRNKTLELSKSVANADWIHFNFGDYVNKCLKDKKDFEFEFSMKPSLTAGNYAIYLGSMFQIQPDSKMLTYTIQVFKGYTSSNGADWDTSHTNTFSMNEFATYTIHYNSSSDTTDLYINGDLIVEGAIRRLNSNGSINSAYVFDKFGVTINNGMRGSVYIDDVKITCDDVNTITLSEDSTASTIKASAYVTDGVLVIASYSADGKVLVNVDYKAVTNSNAEVEIEKDDNLTYKAFIFDNFSNLKPLCDVTAYGVGDL